MNLLIVESPAKAKTIEKYLGKDFHVLASFGHVRDLPKSTLGVEVKENFAPKYIIPVKAKKVIKALKDESLKADIIYLATDYDREGEAIAWHVVQAIGLKAQGAKIKAKKVHRITFTEITKQALLEAVKNPREIDLNLVDAQQARRVLDRLVGYKLSPFLWRKVAQGLSAGRVQSVALRLVVERERQISEFMPVEYWTIEAELENKQKDVFTALLTEKDGQKIDKLAIKNKKEAEKAISDLQKSEYVVENLKKEIRKKYPSPPFTTSTLQQEAGRKLRFSAKQTMRIAQDLYEDGFITYMRTDSVNISQEILKKAPQIIIGLYGEKYALSSPRYFKTKARGAQEAHEAIRPTDLSIDPNQITKSDKHQKLFNLIRKRMLASQMAEAEVEDTTAKISAGNYIFTAKGTRLLFDGFLKAYEIDEEDFTKTIPKLETGEILKLLNLNQEQHFTEPPARFTEGALIKELEKRGIGRPSTYAPTLATIEDRGYVEKAEGKLIPKEIGLAVNDILVAHFPEIVDFDFTAKMEEDLDKIAEGELEWQPVIKNFYDPFEKHLTEKMETVAKNKVEEQTEEKCSKCGKSLVIKLGRFGKFMACSGFPDCKFTKPYGSSEKEQIELSDKKCPKCGKDLQIKEARFGKFLACSGYPDCKYTETLAPKAEVKCPNCGGDLIMRKSKKGRVFWGCSGYPKCKTAFWNEPVKEKCPTCQNLMVKMKTSKLKCSVCK
jgi:DNA topoisomerase-1